MSESSLVNISRQLKLEILDELKSAFVGKDEIIDLLGICLVAGENLFLPWSSRYGQKCVGSTFSQTNGGTLF